MGQSGRPKGSKDKQKRKKREDTAGNINRLPESLRHGPNIKKLVEKNEKKEEISRIVGESFQYFGRRPCLSNDEIADRLNIYFQQCYDTGQIPTVEDMALALGINRKVLYHWETRVIENPERAALIQQAKEVLAAIDAKLVSEGKIPQVTYIFRAKNYFDLRDQQEVVVTPAIDPMGETIDLKRLQQKYLENSYDSETPEQPPKAEGPEIIEGEITPKD